VQALTATQEQSEFQLGNTALQTRRRVSQDHLSEKVSASSVTALTLECFQQILVKQVDSEIMRVLSC
jgi:hypothetical protein